ncbi:hypothetical protein [Natronospora cellulosivora (SeqCode)]
MNKRKALIMLLIIVVFLLTACFTIDFNSYTIEGYVIDIVSKEHISDAEIYLPDWDGGQKVSTSNQDGYFKFVYDFEDIYVGHCLAEGYGTLSTSLRDSTIQLISKKPNKIYLIKPYGVYGFSDLDYEKLKELEILLEGKTFKGDSYSEVTYFDDDGYFYFENVPFHTRLNLYVYNKEDGKEASIYTRQTSPVHISRYGVEFFNIDKRFFD